MSVATENHIPLCAPMLGLASHGYGICQTSTNSDFVSSGTLATVAPTPFGPLANRANQFAIDSGEIHMGHGEYIVFRELPNDTSTSPAKNIFEQAYKIFNECSPAPIINDKPTSAAMDHCINRYDIIRTKIKKIDPTLEIAFIPRTLYELVLIRKCIREDLKNQSICILARSSTHENSLEVNQNNQELRQQFLAQQAATRKKSKCWHLCFFKDKCTNDDFAAKEIADRLNRVLVKTFAPKAQGFTYQELAHFAENEISFLNYYYEATEQLKDKGVTPNFFPYTIHLSFSGPTAHFSAYKNSQVSMTVRTREDAQIIREALALDCCRAAQNHFFLYRGAKFAPDHPAAKDKKSSEVVPLSLSYGSSLFAGSAHDVTATSFHHMRDKSDAYVIMVPFDQLNSSPFYIPTTNAIAQFFSSGEFFHGRSKIWKEADIKATKGIFGSAKKKMDGESILRSNFAQEELVEHFQHYKNNAIHLRHPKCIKSPMISKL